MTRVEKGFAAGAWATLAMAGAGLSIRRLLSETEALTKTDPEHTIDWLFECMGKPAPSPRVRRRLADPLHFLVGGTGGAAYALALGDREISPWRGGAAVAVTMWTLGFCGYFPLLGVLAPPWRWKPEKLLTTTTAHLVYGWTMAHLLAQWTRGAPSRPSPRPIGTELT